LSPAITWILRRQPRGIWSELRDVRPAIFAPRLKLNFRQKSFL
jgi:hypothetical protein